MSMTPQEEEDLFFDLSEITDEVDLNDLAKGSIVSAGTSTWPTSKNNPHGRGWTYDPKDGWSLKRDNDSLSSIPQSPDVHTTEINVDVCSHAIAKKYFHITQEDWDGAYSEGAKDALKNAAIARRQRNVRQGPVCDYNGTFEVIWEDRPIFTTGVVGFMQCKDCRKKLADSRRRP